MPIDRWARQAGGVFRPVQNPVAVRNDDVAMLARDAAHNGLHKSRILLHGDPRAGLHQMLITHRKGPPILPHINDRGAKSYHMVAGRMTVVFFGEDGSVAHAVSLSEPGWGDDFILRWDRATFHTVLAVSDSVCFVETINGPHRETRYAAWSPHAPEAIAAWWTDLYRCVKVPL